MVAHCAHLSRTLQVVDVCLTLHANSTKRCVAQLCQRHKQCERKAGEDVLLPFL